MHVRTVHRALLLLLVVATAACDSHPASSLTTRESSGAESPPERCLTAGRLNDQGEADVNGPILRCP